MGQRGMGKDMKRNSDSESSVSAKLKTLSLLMIFAFLGACAEMDGQNGSEGQWGDDSASGQSVPDGSMDDGDSQGSETNPGSDADGDSNEANEPPPCAEIEAEAEK